jgi:hypothetical protein
VTRRNVCLLIMAQMLMTTSAFAMSKEFQGFISKAPCATQVKEATSQVLFNQSWYPLMISRPGKRLTPGIAFRNTRTGNGYQLFSDASSTTLAEFKIDGQPVSSSVWDQHNGCLVRTSSYRYKRVTVKTAAERQGKPTFTDKDLFDTMKSSKWGVIYVWSPNMPLSIVAMKELKDAMASRSGGKLTILLDGKTSIKAAEELVASGEVQASEIKQVSSPELFARNMTLHYPVAFIYKNGQLSSRKYIGHKRSEIFGKWIDTSIAEME